jgi:large subunit ribosomal protein L5
MNPLHKSYTTLFHQDLLLRGEYKNPHQVPKMDKVVLNLGMKDFLQDKKRILIPLLALEALTGQRAVTTTSRKMVASLRIRKGALLGAKITLRGSSLYVFLTRLNILLFPRLKQWKGFSGKEINAQGNLSFRLPKALDFMELERHYDLFPQLPPLDITMVTSAKTKEEGRALFTSFPFPFVS